MISVIVSLLCVMFDLVVTVDERVLFVYGILELSIKKHCSSTVD